jgi:hypothetical protein
MQKIKIQTSSYVQQTEEVEIDGYVLNLKTNLCKDLFDLKVGDVIYVRDGNFITKEIIASIEPHIQITENYYPGAFREFLLHKMFCIYDEDEIEKAIKTFSKNDYYNELKHYTLSPLSFEEFSEMFDYKGCIQINKFRLDITTVSGLNPLDINCHILR